MRNASRAAAVGAYCVVSIVLALGIKYESRAAVAAGTALVVSVAGTVMTLFYAWLLKATGQTRIRVRTGQRFWSVVAVTMCCAAIASFCLISDATVAGFFGGLALYGLQSSSQPPGPTVLANE